MFRFTVPAVLSAAVLAGALPSVKRQETKSVEWGECGFKHENNYQVDFECGKLTVPLDYTDKDNDATLDLDLIKISATAEPRLGSMFFNPGGPGESAIVSALGNAQELQVIAGGHYDIVAFDPRGTGRTMPIICSDPPPAEETVEKREPLLHSEELMAVAERRWPLFEAGAQNCSRALAENGTFYGTTFVARDMSEIVNAIEDDGMLRYYGVSYGTLLGWTFAAMFPEQVDRMILDGNVNPVQYWSGLDLESTSDTDGLLTEILKACLEAGDICPLAEYGDVESILAAVNSFLESWELIPDPSYPTLMVGVAELKFMLLKNMYATSQFPLLTATIAQMLSGDLSSEEAPAEATEPVEKWHQAQEGMSIYGIRCSDWPIRASDPSELESIFEMIDANSLSDTMVGDFAACYSWPFMAAEQYTGDFTAKTAHPVLFVNPTYDPVTPLRSARNASASLEGSVVLEHHGLGHGVLTQTSLCTTTYMRNYMVDGSLPDEDTVCEPDMPAYSIMTGLEFAVVRQEGIWKELIELAGAVKVKLPEQEVEGDGSSSEGNGTIGEVTVQEKSSASLLRAPPLVVAGIVGGLMMMV